MTQSPTIKLYRVWNASDDLYTRYYRNLTKAMEYARKHVDRGTIDRLIYPKLSVELLMKILNQEPHVLEETTLYKIETHHQLQPDGTYSPITLITPVKAPF